MSFLLYDIIASGRAKADGSCTTGMPRALTAPLALGARDRETSGLPSSPAEGSSDTDGRRSNDGPPGPMGGSVPLPP